MSITQQGGLASPPVTYAASLAAPRALQLKRRIRLECALIATALLALLWSPKIAMAAEDDDDDFVLESLIVRTTSSEAPEDEEMELEGGINLGISFEGEDDDTVTTAGLLVGTLHFVTTDGVALEIRLTGLGIEVSWAAADGPYQLEFKLDLSAAAWDPINSEIEIHEDTENGRRYVLLPLSEAMQFLRLSR